MEDSTNITEDAQEEIQEEEVYTVQREEKKLTKEEELAKKKEARRKQELEDALATERDEKRQERTIHFENSIDLGSLVVMGLVFFVTCFIGLLYNVSAKALSFRVLISCLVTAVFVCICRAVIKKSYDPNKDDDSEQDVQANSDENNKEEPKG